MVWILILLGVYGAIVAPLTINYAPILFFPAIFLPAVIVLLIEMSRNTWKENLGILTIGLIGCLCSTI